MTTDLLERTTKSGAFAAVYRENVIPDLASWTASGERCALVTLVGVDEADLSSGKISWRSPVAQALMKAKVDDCVPLRTPSGLEEVEIVAIRYGS